MNSASNKKEFFYVVVLILTFITVIVGATFAIYALIKRQEEGTSAVYTGTLSIEYLSGDIINCNLLKPMSKLKLDDDSNVYKNNFKVTNMGSLDSLLSIVLEINILCYKKGNKYIVTLQIFFENYAYFIFKKWVKR